MKMTKKNICISVIVVGLVVLSYLKVLPKTTAVQIVFNAALMVAGFVLLIKGADIFVDGASKIATRLNIPQMVIGLTIVACGTYLQEAAVSMSGALSVN